MSQFLNEAESHRSGDDELKQSLKSLRPRSTVDAKALLAEVASRTESDLAPVAAPQLATSQPPQRAASSWWPALTALSWLVTAGVWWSSQAGGSVDEPANGITTAATEVGDARDNSDSAGQLGESIAAGEPDASDDVMIDAADRSTASQSPPIWLALLGLEFSAFDPQAGERRWEQIEQQSEAANWPSASGEYSGGQATATYASLRSEFGNPIRQNWLSQ